MASTIIVTGSDANYYEWASELIGSIRSFPQLGEFKIGFLDSGLGQEQIDELRGQGVLVAKAKWEFPGQPPADMRLGYLAMLARPFLPNYFPGYDFYVSLDSDTWVQEPGAIGDLIEAAGSEDVAVIPEVNTAYSHMYSHFYFGRQIHAGIWTAVFGKETARFAENAIFNGGVFAARRDSALWNAWQQSLTQAVVTMPRTADPFKTAEGGNNYLHHFIEQVALNHAIYSGKVSISPCSALYNWICQLSLPVFDAQAGKLVEPCIPRSVIRIVHLTGNGKETKQVKDVRGQVLQRGLRWSDWHKSV